MISPSSTPLLVDSDILIDFLRGRAEAATFFEATENRLLVSAISVAELFAGVRDDREAVRLTTFLGAFEVVTIDADIAAAGGRYRARYGPSDGTGLADALIAASAEAVAAQLVTRNQRHFRMLGDMFVPY